MEALLVLFATESYNHEDFLKQIEAIEADGSVSGIFGSQFSQGGGVYESAEIANLLNEVRTERDLPMYVSMKNMAASGGYYISAQADKIFATGKSSDWFNRCHHVRTQLFGLARKKSVSKEIQQ